MKKTIAILLMLTISFAAAFAVETATLNLTTTVAGVTNVAVVKASSVPSTFPTSGIIGDAKQDVTSAPVNYAFVVETNQNLAEVTVQANPLKSGSNFITYTVTAGSLTSTATDVAGTAVKLMDASTNTVGKKVTGGVFAVQGVSTTDSASVANHIFGLNNAPAGTYEGSVTIFYTAN
ncbi:MAG: hypothetical protein SPD11_14250 [Sphaerochaetaceae bacterium]|nr:hypothetical protein [Sphaerochaetaceae bacterium]